MERPKVIFLDAVGTLFGIQGSVGEVYGAFARQAGVDVAPEILDRAFIQSFKNSPPLAFPGVEVDRIPELEYQWWYAIAASTFNGAGVLNRFDDFDAAFGQLYDYFATESPWYIYPDVLPALEHWQQKGVQLGIISNFDSRIYPVLERLQIDDFFSSITISTEIGAAKPENRIFAAALQKHRCLPQEAWHIGDSLQEDYYGAKSAGLKPVLVERSR